MADFIKQNIAVSIVTQCLVIMTQCQVTMLQCLVTMTQCLVIMPPCQVSITQYTMPSYYATMPSYYDIVLFLPMPEKDHFKNDHNIFYGPNPQFFSILNKITSVCCA